MYFVSAVDYNNMGKFLNRILGMEVQQQNALFQYFSDTLAAVIQEAKKNGRYDMGILGKIIIIIQPPSQIQKQNWGRRHFTMLNYSKCFSSMRKSAESYVSSSCPLLDLGSGDEKVKKVDCRKFLTPGYTTAGHVDLYTVCSYLH